MREGRRRNPEPLFSARVGVSPHERWRLWSVPFRRGFSELSYPAHSLRRGYRAETPCGGHSSTARPRPIFRFVWSVSRLSFVFTCPRAPPPPDFHGAAVKQAIPTLPVETVVTPQPSVNVTGVSARRRADDSLLSPRGTGSEPRAHVEPQSMGAEIPHSGDV